MFRFLKSFWRFIFGTRPKQRPKWEARVPPIDWAAASPEHWKSVVISKPGAHLHVVRIELSPEAKRALTTGVRGIDIKDFS